MNEEYQKTISQKDIEEEIRIAESENRDADFSNQKIDYFNFSKKTINCNLLFRNSSFVGSLYLGKTKIKGNLVLGGAMIKNTLYLAESEIKGNLMMSEITVNNSINMIRSKVSGSVLIENSSIHGFLSLGKTEIGGNLNMRHSKITNIENSSGTIKGDLHMQGAKIQKSVDMEWIYISGLADLQRITVLGSLNISNSKIIDVLFLKDSYIEKDVLINNIDCGKKIISF
jgi:hypothetical protein